MVDSSVMPNGSEPIDVYQSLPDCLTISAADANRVPSPGTLRTLKAQLGKTWGELMGPEADDADRFQTVIWVRLRRDRPDLRWEDCADVELIIEDAAAALAPLAPSTSSSAPSPASAASGG